MSSPQLDPQRSPDSSDWRADHARAWQQLTQSVAELLAAGQRCGAAMIWNARSTPGESFVFAVAAGLIFNLVLSLVWTGAAAAGDLRLTHPRTTVWLLAGLAVANSGILILLKQIQILDSNDSTSSGSITATSANQSAMQRELRALLAATIHGLPAATVICVLPIVISGIALWPDSNWIFAEAVVLVISLLSVASSPSTQAEPHLVFESRTVGESVKAAESNSQTKPSVSEDDPAIENPAEPIRLEHLDERPVRQQTWQQSEEELRIEGDETVRFAPGQRVSVVHLVFHPPLPQTPEFYVELDADANADADSNAIGDADMRLKIAGVYPHGVRIEARRSGSDVSPVAQRFNYVAVCQSSRDASPSESAVA